MGFFGKLFGSDPAADIRRQLEQTYTQSFVAMGFSASQARTTVREMLDRAEQRSRQHGTNKFPPGFGDMILAKKTTDESIRRMVERLYAEGVRDEDIRWWWNLHDLERCMLVESDEMSRFTVFADGSRQGKTAEEAAATVAKWFTIFGVDPKDGIAPDDQPLPFELKDRINRYFERFSPSERAALKAKIAQHSSMNAFIRSEIRAKRL